MMLRANEPWTPEEVAFLAKEKVAGKTNIEIANRLKRTQAAIENRCKREGLVSRRRCKPPVVHIETIAVSKDLVCHFYEKGWRFDGFSSEGLCIMRKERRL